MALAAALLAPEKHSGLLLSLPYPEHYRRIERRSFSTVDEVVELMRPQSEASVPLIIEGSEMIEVEKWQPLAYASSLLQDRKARKKRRECRKGSPLVRSSRILSNSSPVKVKRCFFWS